MQQTNKLEKVRSCPKCTSTKVMTERRINGDSTCSECKYKDKTGNFTFEIPTFKQYLKMTNTPPNPPLFEDKKQEDKGIYIAVKYNQTSSDEIIEFIDKYKIPSVLKSEDIHTTIIYSTKFAEISELDDNMEDSEIVAYPKDFHIFETFDKKRALVLLLDCEYLNKRHEYLMSKYDLNYGYPEYIPHVTLSYDIGDFDMKTLKDAKLPKFLRILCEYQEDLNLEKKYD